MIHYEAYGQVILSRATASLLKPTIIKFVQHAIYDQEKRYACRSIAEAFGITPREVGYDFDTWEEQYKAETRSTYPMADVPVPSFG